MVRNTSKIPSTVSRADHRFSLAPQATIPRSKFDRSRGLKTTFDAGLLIPILVDEALPGDTFHLSMTALARMATPIFPLMDNLYLDFHFFAVPNRLVWEHWEAFCGDQPSPGDTTDYLVPQVTSPAGGFAEGSLFDYLGLPTSLPTGSSGGTISVNSLHMRAYNFIWNTWYRDENLQDAVTVNRGDTSDPISDYAILPRGKRKDYFTSCLPWPQKGPDVLLPLGQTAPVMVHGPITPNATSLLVGQDTTDTYWTLRAAAGTSTNDLSLDVNTGTGIQTIPPVGGFYTDLTDATASTINDIRLAFQTQKLYERDARGGTRYIEILQSHFGVTSPDFRLQRPEYLGGGTIPVMVSPVPQTSGSGAYTATPQGSLSGFGVAHGSKIGFTKSFVEHSVILGFVSVRADLNYQQGIHRMWSRQTRLDYYWPVLACIGEQAVLNQEIYAQGSLVIDSGTAAPFDEGVFGYQERWAEYRYGVSLITGAMRSNATSSLDAWHLAQDFGSLPTLGSTFIVENPPMDRVEAVPSEPSFIMDAFFKMHCARPMPIFSVPGLVDHF